MSRKIMAVDDDPDQLAIMDSLLRAEGFTIETAGNGQEALDKVNRFRPDVMLVDVSMPKMNGFTLCDTLKKNPAFAAIRILMVTGFRGPFSQINGMAHGADAYLYKPFKAEELITAVNKLLA